MTQVLEPRDYSPNDKDWQDFLYRTTFQNGGYIKLMLRELNTSEEPLIARGSRLEVNGTFYSLPEDMEILDPHNVAYEQWIFIYAAVQPNSLKFEYRNTLPKYDTAKCGWFDGTDRAISKLYLREDGWWSKVILEDYESMFKNNFTVLPTTGGELIGEGGINNFNNYIVNPGAYRWELQAGLGGRGGYSGNATQGTPGLGAEGEILADSFTVEQKTQIELLTGGDGNNGLPGGGNSGGGWSQSGPGGGGPGGNSEIKIEGNYSKTARGGAGGGGAGTDGSARNGGGGGGGAAGYGQGGDGTSEGMNQVDGQPGKGGSLAGGGAGGAGMGQGVAGEAGTESAGGQGGYFISDSVGGLGGTGVMDTSSGYSKLFKLWENIYRTELEII